MSELPDGLQALDLITERQPAVFYDFDGTLSEIVEDPDSARLVDGAADALTSLSAAVPGGDSERARPGRRAASGSACPASGMRAAMASS